MGKAKIVLHENTMPIMDATKYWADIESGTTVADLVEFIATEYGDANGEIIMIGEPYKDLTFTEGKMDKELDEDLLKRELISVEVTQYYCWNHTTNFAVILD